MEEKKYNNLNHVEENIYKEIIENSSTAIALLDADGRISLINDAFCTISGYSREELIGENWTDKIPEDEKDRLLILTRKRVKDVPSKHEFKFNKKNGELRYGLITAAVIKSTNKTVITFTDITERKMQEEALREREVHYRSLIEYANDIIYSLTVEGILIYASPNWTERLGHKMNEIIGHSFTEFVHPDDIFRLAKLIVENFSHGEKLNDIVYRVKDINNEWHWYSSSSSPIFDSAGHVVSLIGIAHDITEQKIAEQNIIDSQAKLNMALKIAQLGTWERNLETNSFIFNDSFYDIFKTSAEEVGGYTMTSHEYIERFVHPDDRDMIRHKIKDTDIVLSNNTVFNLEHRIIFPNGEVGHIAVYFTSLLNEKGETIKTFGINQNITERKKAEQAIIDSENQLREMNAAKDKFFSIIAHDLRSPFSTVVGISELMADSNSKLTLEEMRENSQLLYKAACSTFSLLENLLEWSKLQRGLTVIHRETIELRKFIDNINESAIESAKKKSIKLTIEIEKDLKVNADPNMLHSILRNLITNAIKFTNTGGAVIVLAKQIENKTRLFQVKDTGIGMPPKIINNLFRIDANNSRPGTNDEPSSGLGLILCKEFIEKHGGKIWAESTVGIGSTFSFTIR